MHDGSTPGASGRAQLRWRDCVAAVRARWEAHGAAQRERVALREFGAALANHRPASTSSEELQAALDAVAHHADRLEALRTALAASIEDDRIDWAETSSWMRPLVVLRGIATRSIVRHRIRSTRRGLAAAQQSLGSAALDAGTDAHATAGPPLLAAAEARRRSAAATAALDVHLANVRLARATRIAEHVAREAAVLGRPMALELRGRLLPRFPALAGLAIGWWIAKTFTDSRFSAALHSLGIGSGPRRVVSSETLRAMEFWLPILAAAVCSYATGRIAALVRSRYEPATSPEDGSAPSGARTRHARADPSGGS